MKRIFFFVILALVSLSYGFAQTLEDEDTDKISLVVINTKDPKIDIVKDFHNTAGQHFLDPKAPRFLLYDQKNKVAFGIGGYVRMRAAYNFNGSPSNSFGFIPYSIPVPANSLTKDRLAMDASKSTLFFKLLGNNEKVGQFQVYVSGNFTGNGNAFVLNDAYIKLMGFTIGQTWSTFNDLAAVPPTVDFQGPNGAAEMRTAQIRYTHNISDALSFAIAAELPKTTGTYIEGKAAEMSQRIPDVPIYLQYNFGKSNGSHVRLSGVVSNINYKNLEKNKTETATGLGVQFSGNIEANPIIQFYGQITYGTGIAQYINDLSGNGLSIVADPNNPGKMKPLEALGWFAQVKFNLTKSLYATAGYSQARVYPKDGTFSDTQYRYGEYVVGNLFYNLTSDFQLGLEYLWGNRVNLGKEKGSANCIQSVIQYNF